MRAEGLFLNFSTSEITTIQAKAKTLLTEGKTLMAYGIGGRINADIIAVKRDKICVILGLLERTEMIRRRATKKHTIITLVNWSRYQIEETLSGHKPDTERTREKKGKEREEEIALPEELDTPDFRKAWSEWTEYRRESKKKLTKSTITRQLGSLAKLGEDAAIASIDQSISNGWTGLFEPKGDAARPSGVTIDEAFLQMDCQRGGANGSV